MSIPMRDKKTNIRSDISRGKLLQKKIKTLANEVAEKSIDSEKTLNQIIAEVSQKESFNRLQIQRLVEESNTVAYNKRYDKLKNVNDRRIEFPIASLDGVVEEMGADAPEEMVNPNFSTGASGSGSMDKAAAIESTPIHTPNSKVSDRHKQYQDRLNRQHEKQMKKEAAAREKEYESGLFKIANSLVMSERQYKNANKIFNTMLDDIPLPEEAVRGIMKKASDISAALIERGRCHKGFVVPLEQNHVEKAANHLLGEFSLLKEAENTPKVEAVKVQPTADIGDFEQLINLARKLEKQQFETNNPAPAVNEVN